MLDFISIIFSSITDMDFKDHHTIPFALPLLIGCGIVGTVAFTIVKSVESEHKEEREASNQDRM